MNEKIAGIISDLEKIADYLPGALIVHDVRDLSIVYISALGLSKIGLTLEEVKKLSAEEYHNRYFNREDAADYVPKVKEILLKKDNDSIVTFFQQVRKCAETDWQWHLSNSKVLLRDESGEALLIITLANPIDPYHHITHKVSRLLEENNFIRNKYKLFSKLSTREKEVLVLTVKGFSAPEMGEKLNISALTVETHRRNVKTKLGVASNYELMQYAQAFDLLREA